VHEKNTIQQKVEYIENANNTHIKQTKNDRTSKCQQILPQWSSVDSGLKIDRFKVKNEYSRDELRVGKKPRK
jgi:hypothetical protein